MLRCMFEIDIYRDLGVKDIATVIRRVATKHEARFLQHVNIAAANSLMRTTSKDGCRELRYFNL